MSKRPITDWTVHELSKIVAKKFEAAAKCQPGPKRQKLLREAKRYKTLLEKKTSLVSADDSMGLTSARRAPQGGRP
jgi:hypothetical protein